MKQNAHNAALNLLARREHSAQELARKLQTKGFDAAEITAALETLTAKKLLNEQRFVESYIRMRSNKGYGPLRIQEELKIRGIPEDVIEENLNMHDNSWHLSVVAVWKKHFHAHMPRDFDERAKQMRFLQYRGFTLEQISKIFKKDFVIE